MREATIRPFFGFCHSPQPQQFLNQIATTGALARATPARSMATFQVKYTNTANQSTINFQVDI